MKDGITEKLLEKSIESKLATIIDLVKLNDGNKIHKDYAMEKFEHYIKRFDIQVTDKEIEYLIKLRVDNYDKNSLPIKKIDTRDSLVKVDFVNKKIIKP